MKTVLKFAFAIFLFTSLIVTAANALPKTTISVENYTIYDLGTVKITSDNGDVTKIDVPGPGTFNTTIKGEITKVHINGQHVNKNGRPTDVTLES
ncbi:MAG: hypothetical protein ABI778_10120, partial [Ignavibacteriota bacterium]